MPLSFSFDGKIIIIRMEGSYSTSELKTVILKALDAPATPADAVMMFDLRESLALRERSMEEVRDMAKFLAANGARFNNRLAMVAPTDLAYGLMRVGSVTADMGGLTSMVFRRFEEAREWLLMETFFAPENYHE